MGLAISGSGLLKNRPPVRGQKFYFAKFSATQQILKKKLGRCDRFCQQIVEIGAILAIFEPLEVLKIHTPFFGEFSRSSRDLCHNGGYNAMNPGTIG